MEKNDHKMIIKTLFWSLCILLICQYFPQPSPHFISKMAFEIQFFIFKIILWNWKNNFRFAGNYFVIELMNTLGETVFTYLTLMINISKWAKYFWRKNILFFILHYTWINGQISNINFMFWMCDLYFGK